MRESRWLLTLSLLALVTAPVMSQPQRGPFPNPKPGQPPALEPYQMVVRQLTRQALKTASTLCQEGLYQQAEHLLRRVERLNPGDPEIHQAIKAVRFVSGSDYNVFQQTHEPRDLPNICNRPGSCVVLPPPHPPLPKNAITEYLASMNRTKSACVGGSCPVRQTDPTCDRCQTKPSTSNVVHGGVETDNCTDCACAKGCKCCEQTCCCVAKCGCGKNCACNKQCCCGKECACGKARTVNTYLPPAGHAVIWVMPASGVDMQRCPVLNKTMHRLAPKPRTEWIFHSPNSRPPVAYRPIVRTHPWPPVRVTVSKEYRQHGTTTGTSQRATPNIPTRNVVPYVEVLPDYSGAEESEPRGPIRVRFLPSSHRIYRAEPVSSSNRYKSESTPVNRVHVFDFYSGTIR